MNLRRGFELSRTVPTLDPARPQLQPGTAAWPAYGSDISQSFQKLPSKGAKVLPASQTLLPASSQSFSFRVCFLLRLRLQLGASPLVLLFELCLGPVTSELPVPIPALRVADPAACSEAENGRLFSPASARRGAPRGRPWSPPAAPAPAASPRSPKKQKAQENGREKTRRLLAPTRTHTKRQNRR